MTNSTGNWRSVPRFRTPKAVCPHCGDTYAPIPYADGRFSKACGKQGCLAEAIRSYWKALGFVATVKYADGCPRLVGVPVRM